MLDQGSDAAFADALAMMGGGAGQASSSSSSSSSTSNDDADSSSGSGSGSQDGVDAHVRAFRAFAGDAVGMSTYFTQTHNLAAWAREQPAQRTKRERKQGVGLRVIPNALPRKVALGVRHVLRALPDAFWQHTTASTDVGTKSYGSASIAHAFTATAPNDNDSDHDDHKGNDNGHDADLRLLLRKLLPALLPGRQSTFQCGRYLHGHYIAPHDDAAYVKIKGETFSREFAAVYYANTDWESSDGGSFVDMETGRTFLPSFNTLVIFRVPRLHQVLPVISKKRARLSLFGWFLAPGEQYRLGKQSNNSKPGKKHKKKKNKSSKAKRGSHEDDAPEHKRARRL